ncbi:hypothetical protein [Hyalangium minutum]|uniref:Uncharacterized protein n=1 Tax=Hyalangium minutum TaxID=394096 RepID=A0A085W928_9BACT|nr:hypothetical protein [Hyalangium minutum]KFE64191.1 hypothetical protein DB31_1985 [Hyalangium minutum]
MIARFRATAPPGAILAQTFHRGAFDALLAQPTAAGIRIYYGKYASGADTLVLYATNGEGQDLSAMPMNHCQPCPSLCDTLPANSHLISPAEAQETINRFQATAPPGAVRSQSLDRSAIDVLLAQPTAAGIRIYYGKYANGANTLVLYAINKQGQVISTLAMDHCTPCPPTCDAQAASTRSSNSD